MLKASSARAPERGFTLIELLVVIAIIAVLISLLAARPCSRRARRPAAPSASTTSSSSALACHNYIDANGVFPLGTLHDAPAGRRERARAAAGTSTASWSGCSRSTSRRSSTTPSTSMSTMPIPRTGPSAPPASRRIWCPSDGTVSELARPDPRSDSSRCGMRFTSYKGNSGTWFSPGRYQDPSNAELLGTLIGQANGIFNFYSKTTLAVDHRRHEQHHPAWASTPGARSAAATSSAGPGGPRATTPTRCSPLSIRSTRSTRSATWVPGRASTPTSSSRPRRASIPAGRTSPSATARSGSSRTRSSSLRSTRRDQPAPEHHRAIAQQHLHDHRPSCRSIRRSRPATAAKSSAPMPIDRWLRCDALGGLTGQPAGRALFRWPDTRDVRMLCRRVAVRGRQPGLDEESPLDQRMRSMPRPINRRHFLGTTAAASLSTLAIGAAPAKPPGQKAADRRRQRQRPAARSRRRWSWSSRGTTRWTPPSRAWRSSRPTPTTIRSAWEAFPTRTASSSSTRPSCTGRPTAAARSPRSATSCIPPPSPAW